MRVRNFPEEGYKAIFTDSFRTLRLGSKIPEIKYPEFFDVAINEKCLAGCPYCYVSAMAIGENYDNILDRIDRFFSPMDMNQRPFQVAIGGHGEPTLHPQFCEVLEKFDSLGIVPNYTSNGMHLSDKVMDATKKWAGGVAISCHPHLDKVRRRSAHKYIEEGVRLNLHVIVGENDTADRFKRIFEEFDHGIEYVVCLPYSATGRAKEVEVEKEWEKFFDILHELGTDKIGFGANFYPYILENYDKLSWLDLSLYEPESLSGYIMFNHEEPIVRKSSYDLTVKNTVINKGRSVKEQMDLVSKFM